MSIKAFLGSESNQGTIGTKRVVVERPVLITDRGESAEVPLTFDRHNRLETNPQRMIDLLGLSEAIEFESPRAGVLSRAADLI